jgi:uncharacterized protein YebE (UPF0316 family)
MIDWFLANERWFTYLVLPAMIFGARVADVTLDTMRVIFLNRGRKIVAPILGFFEVLIWILAISQVMKNLTNPVCYLAYGAGFATGNFVGILIEEKVAAGWLAVRIITAKDVRELIAALRSSGHGITTLDGHGADGPVNVVYAVIRRKNFPRIVEQIQLYTPDAFYTVEEIRSLAGGHLAPSGPGWRPSTLFRWGSPEDR